ncbi:MAG: hypothetical protein K9J48_04475 [Desulfohalobiaceae bacterium]|nr:hypothetical protein [Desulfohalobiaceae bacterium]
MQDKQGVFYYPLPQNKQVKMYVRENNGVVEFRLHNEMDPGLYQEHGWITHEMARQASQMYTGKGSDPLSLYDIDAAMAALKQARSE